MREFVWTNTLRYVESPYRRVSYSGGPKHGTTTLVEDAVMVLGDSTTDPPTQYRRETPASTRFLFVYMGQP